MIHRTWHLHAANVNVIVLKCPAMRRCNASRGHAYYVGLHPDDKKDGMNFLTPADQPAHAHPHIQTTQQRQPTMTPTFLSALTATSPILNATITISQRVFQLKAVSEQARDLLETSNQITQTLSYARDLQTQKAPLLSASEKQWVDDVLESTERALKSFATLIEPARVDMQTSREGAISLCTRAFFVLRDSPKVSVNLARLQIAVQHLNSVVGILSGRNGVVSGGRGNRSSCSSGGVGDALHAGSVTPSSEVKAAPPTYEESEFLNRRRSGLPGSRGRSAASTPQPMTPTLPAPAPALIRVASQNTPDVSGLELNVGEAAASPCELSNVAVVEAGLHACADWEPVMAHGHGLGEATAPQDSAVLDGLGKRSSRSELTMPGRLAGRRRGQAWLAYQAGVSEH